MKVSESDGIITLTCNCGKQLQTDPSFSGREFNCPVCGLSLRFELAGIVDGLTTKNQIEPIPTLVEKPSPQNSLPQTINNLEVQSAQKSKAEINSIETTDRSRPVTSFLFLFLVALLPLIILSVVVKGETDFEKRLDKTLVNETSAVQIKVHLAKEKGERNLDAILMPLSQQKLIGAALPRSTKLHWIFALSSMLLFMLIMLVISLDEHINPSQVLKVGLFTATGGIFLLQLLHFAAQLLLFSGVLLNGPGIALLPLLIFFGFFYLAGVQVKTGFLISIPGYICGVGLVEELCKMLPLLYLLRAKKVASWQHAMVLGMASAAGFAIAEGILYSSSFYNGISSWDSYAIRFISCVALHSIWSATAGITIFNKQNLVTDLKMDLSDIAGPLCRMLALVAILHGLYDAFLMAELLPLALVVAVVSYYNLVRTYLSVNP